jgi:O-methyltransferase involved in polyketide biosynthesis
MSHPLKSGSARAAAPPWIRHYPPDHPAVLDYRVSDLEGRAETIEDRVSLLEEAKQRVSILAGLPWAQLAPLIVTIVLGVLLNLKPDEIAALVKGIRQ